MELRRRPVSLIALGLTLAPLAIVLPLALRQPAPPKRFLWPWLAVPTGIAAVGTEAQGRGAVERQLVDIGRELVLVIQHLVEGDELAGVRGHAAHRRDHARLRPALHLVVRLVLADRGDQILPLVVVG